VTLPIVVSPGDGDTEYDVGADTVVNR